MTTQTKYKSIRKAAVKYAGLALLAGALALPFAARSESFPIESEAKSEVVSTQEQIYNNALTGAKSVFNSGIKSRHLSLIEQRQIEKYLDEAKAVNKNLPAEYTDLDSLIHKNLEEWDVGTPSLQEKLREQGMGVEVEASSLPECRSAIVFTIGALMSVGLSKLLRSY